MNGESRYSTANASAFRGKMSPGLRLLAGLFCLSLMLFLGSCVESLMQQTGLSSSTPGAASAPATLPKIEIMPPANFTKGAPAYEMRFLTTSSSIPGMGGAMGGLMGADASRIVTLRMVSHPGPAGGASPKAYHMIPAGMRMGDYLPLLPPEKGTDSAAAAVSESEGSEKPERMILKIYWGCGETVRKGQPRVYDTSKMKGDNFPSMGGFGGADSSAWGGGSGGLKSGWVEVLWPNKEDSREVPENASMVGDHLIHGNFLPHINFSMDAQHDIMGKLSVSAESQSLQNAIPITWRKLPTGIGYQVMAIGFNNSRNETIIWTSSENPDINVSSQFLNTPQVKKYITSKVILPADRDRCVIPKGIFAGVDMVIVTLTAWGDDYWASYPPRPAKAPQNWKPDWTVKGQFLSTGTLMLGADSGSASSSSSGGSGGSGGGSGSGSNAGNNSETDTIFKVLDILRQAR